MRLAGLSDRLAAGAAEPDVLKRGERSHGVLRTAAKGEARSRLRSQCTVRAYPIVPELVDAPAERLQGRTRTDAGAIR